MGRTSFRRGIVVPLLCFAIRIPAVPCARAESLEDRVRALEKGVGTGPGEAAPGVFPDPAAETGKAGGLFGGAALTNPFVSVVVNAFYYGSSRSQEELDVRTIPGYTIESPGLRKGFNLESAELFFSAPVDPYFNLYVTIPVTEDGAEVEEACFVTTSLPSGFQFKGGKFRSGFGKINGQHPHAWDFADVPLNYGAYLGPEGMAEKGIQATLLPSLPVYLLVGVEALQGENPLLFGADAGDGPHAFGAFAKGSVDLSDSATILAGLSAMTGKTRLDSAAPGTVFVGDAALFGAEELKAILNGSILWLTPEEVGRAGLLYAAIGALQLAFRRRFLALSFEGKGGGWWEFLLFLSFALVLVSSVQLAGILQVFSFLVIPALIGRLYTREPGRVLLAGWGIGLAASTAGIALSYRFDLPTAPLIVACLGGTFFLLLLVRLFRSGAGGGEERAGGGG